MGAKQRKTSPPKSRRRPFKDVLRYDWKGDRRTARASANTARPYYLRWREAEGLPMRCDMEDCVFHTAPLVWRGKPLSFDVDHINGVIADNRPSNLRMLCPNCHRQLTTHGGGNKDKTVMEIGGYGRREADKWHYTLPAEPGEYHWDAKDTDLSVDP